VRVCQLLWMLGWFYRVLHAAAQLHKKCMHAAANVAEGIYLAGHTLQSYLKSRSHAGCDWFSTWGFVWGFVPELPRVARYRYPVTAWVGAKCPGGHAAA